MIGVACGFCTGRTQKKIFLKKSRQLKIFFSSSRLRRLDPAAPGSSLNASPSSGEETPPSLPQDARCTVTLACGVSAYATPPPLSISLSVSLTISHPGPFLSRVSSAMSIIGALYRDSCKKFVHETTFTELRDRIPLLK